MTQFHNPHFTTFEGEPITGRTPPKVVVFGEPLNKRQHGETAHAYKLFNDYRMTMLGDFHSKEHILTDASRVRITSANGLDLIQVWTSGGGKPPLDPSGYLTTPIETKYDGKTRGWNTSASGAAISAEAHFSIKDKAVPVVPPLITLHSFYQAGAVSWKTPTGFVLSYDHEGTNRYSTNLWDTAMGAFPNLTNIEGKPNVYYRGTTIYTDNVGVVAAGVFEEWLVIFTKTSAYFATSPLLFLDETLAKGDFIRYLTVDWAPCVFDTSGVPSAVRRCSAWHFKPDGTQAACAIVNAAYEIPDFPWTGGSITPPAGPGYVPPFDHSNTWYMKRALQEALPQAKRYANLTAEGNDQDRYVKLTFVDVPFVGEPLGARFDGSNAAVMFHDYISRGTWPPGGNLTYAPPANPTGLVHYTGKRLWGVDYDEDGNELLVTMHITGTGSVPTSTTYSMDMKWDLRVNGAVILEVPTLASTTGPFVCHYASISAIDARYKAVTYERLIRTATVPGELGTGTLAIEHVFDGEIVFIDPVVVPTEMALTARPQCIYNNPTGTFPSNWGSGTFPARTSDVPGQSLQCGPNWAADNSYGHGGGSVWGGCWPQVQGGSNGENSMEYIVWSEIDSYVNAWDPAFQAGYYPTGPQQYLHYSRYPNQITDALHTSWCAFFRFSISTWSEVGVYKSNTGSYSYIDYGFGSLLRNVLTGYYDGLSDFRYYPYVQGLAKKDYASDHYMQGTINTFSWAMGRYLQSMHLNVTLSFNGFAGPGFVIYYPNNQVAPMHATASLFIRPPIDEGDPTAPRPFVRHEAMQWVADRITTEQASIPDPTSFRIDPIRVI